MWKRALELVIIATALCHSHCWRQVVQPRGLGGLLWLRACTSVSDCSTIDTSPAVERYAQLPEFLDDETTPVLFSLSHDGPDPFKMVSDDLNPLSAYMHSLLESESSLLSAAAKHFFNQRQGKRFRPTIVALLGRCLLDPSSPSASANSTAASEQILRLAQITEMIHVASLIHDDVLDDAGTRRGAASVHAQYSNKVAVLAGDFLLAKASVLLARLRHNDVVEVMASALEALVQGEVMQARGQTEDRLSMQLYLRKTFFKTSSLITASCRSTALLAGLADASAITRTVEEFGYHLGMAYQIVDDILDFTGASAVLGKPAQADMVQGLATAPILFAAESVAALRPLVLRRFAQAGDVQLAVALASATDCVARARRLATFHAERAAQALVRLPDNEPRRTLMRLLYAAITRDK